MISQFQLSALKWAQEVTAEGLEVTIRTASLKHYYRG